MVAESAPVIDQERTTGPLPPVNRSGVAVKSLIVTVSQPVKDMLLAVYPPGAVASAVTLIDVLSEEARVKFKSTKSMGSVPPGQLGLKLNHVTWTRLSVPVSPSSLPVSSSTPILEMGKVCVLALLREPETYVISLEL